MSTISVPKLRPSTPAQLRMSEEEFVDWYDGHIRAEWIDGRVELISPVSADHADLTMFISVLIGGFVAKNDLGKAWADPFQVRLPKQKRRRSPDVFFATKDRLNLLQKNEFNGPPDLIVEVIAPDSQSRDRREKYLEYQGAGVREYWLADPLSRTFEIYSRDSTGKFQPLPVLDGKIHSTVLKGVYFRKEWVYQLKLPDPTALIQEMSRLRKKRPSTRKPRRSDNQS